MRIFIDARLGSYGYQGFNRYLKEVIPWFVNSDHEFFIGGEGGFFKNFESFENVKFLKFDAPIYSINEQIQGISLLMKKIDVFFFPYYSLPIALINKRSVVVINDLIPFIFPGGFSKIKITIGKILIKEMIKKCGKIIVVSNYVKRSLMKFFNLRGEKIEVVYNGVSDMFKRVPDEEIKKFKEQKKLKRFILFVGNREISKNVLRLGEAVKHLRRNYDLELLIVGRKHKKYSLTDRKLSELGDWVKIFYDVPDDEILYYYSSADVFVFPSLSEGFGYPPLEAMKCSCPVAVSDIPVFREVISDSAIYFDPYSIRSIAGAIEKLIFDKKLREEMIKRALKRVNIYRWEDTAAKTLKIIESVI